MAFKKAERRRVWLKIGLMGASGSGKSRSALELAKGLCEGMPICAIDTENGSLSLYSDVASFDVCDLEPPFDPEKYIAAIREAEAEGYRVLIIDSFSHAWKYLLDKKEKLDQRGGRQNNYTNWGPVKAEADRLKDAILQSKLHVIACMRAKTEYSQENGKVQKLGMGAIQEPDVEYEFTTVFQIAMDHTAKQSKDRTGVFGDRIFRIEPSTGAALLDWLGSAASQDTYIPPATTNANAQLPPGHTVGEVAMKNPSVKAQAPEKTPLQKNAEQFLKDIGVATKEMIQEFKAVCKDRRQSWVTVANYASAEGCQDFQQLMDFTSAYEMGPE